MHDKQLQKNGKKKKKFSGNILADIALANNIVT